jgi:hypothetical protein
MPKMPDIGKQLEADWTALKADLTGQHHTPAAASATVSTAQEAPAMASFTQSLREDAQRALEVLSRLGQAADTLGGDPHIDALLEAALSAVHVPAPVFEACVDMLNGAEARAAAVPAAGTPAAIAPPAVTAATPAYDPRSPKAPADTQPSA